jgi:hypothetical protein
MPKRKKAPELAFQQHIADFVVREHGYGALEPSDIADTVSDSSVFWKLKGCSPRE